MSLSSKILSVKPMRHPATNSFIGSVLVFFDNSSEASGFLEKLPRLLPSYEGFWLKFDFYQDFEKVEKKSNRRTDWNCFCGHFNSRRLVVCEKCNASADSGAYLNAFGNAGLSDASPFATDTLLIMGLDVFLSESELFDSLKIKRPPPINVYLAKDKCSKQALGFAFVLFGSEDEATNFLQSCSLSEDNSEASSRKIFLFNSAGGLPICYAQPIKDLLLDYWDNSAFLAAADAAADHSFRECLLFYRELEKDASCGGASTISMEKAPVQNNTFKSFVVRKSASGLLFLRDLDVFFDSRCETLFIFDEGTKMFVGIPKPVLKRFVQFAFIVHARRFLSVEEFRDLFASISSAMPSHTLKNSRNQAHVCLLCEKTFESSSAIEDHLRNDRDHLENISTYTTKRSLASNKDQNDAKPTPYFSSFGLQLLKKMGWKEGVGLGKESTGITAPIEAVARRKNAGLGCS